MSDTQLDEKYKNLVELKYQLYNSLFLTLPLDAVEEIGLLLPLLEEASHRGLKSGKNPQVILEEFFNSHHPNLTEEEKVKFLFKIIQYVERQVVLIDALEDSAYKEIHRTEESNKLRQLIERTEALGLKDELTSILSKFSARVILTAHPTQFYPGTVLAIITDLTDAIQSNDIGLARKLLQQLGNTAFFQKEKPSPFDEAMQLSWYLSNVFYQSIGHIFDYLDEYLTYSPKSDALIHIGFWPGGDRDGNPYVTSKITRNVARKLRSRILECYREEVRSLRRRLSFSGVIQKIEDIENQLHLELTNKVKYCYADPRELVGELGSIRKILKTDFQGLFVDRIDSFERKIHAFGFHFASLDIRQDSRIIHGSLSEVFLQQPKLKPQNFDQMNELEQVESLFSVEGSVDLTKISDPIIKDTLESLYTIREIQEANGVHACHRYIISNCRGAIDVARLYALCRFCGWNTQDFTLDIVPLFETISDLRQSETSMRILYESSCYQEHLSQRSNRQTVMLGFSDGTKDGGYLMANWAIYAAKESLTRISRQFDIEVCFFDGRGGPPARGGGSTYKFYSSLGKNIEANQIQLTVQGQTISSYYGTEVGAIHNLRQLIAAGLENNLGERPKKELSESERLLLNDLAEVAYKKYLDFKSHPLFLRYLNEMSTLNYYGQSNIGSRPVSRNSTSDLHFEDLRAIPFVGAWGQLKQNVPGYFGIGTALKAMEEANRLDDCIALYNNSEFFKALLANSMQSMSKTNFALTQYMKDDTVFGEFWSDIFAEYQLSKEMALKVSGQSVLLEDHPGNRSSIALRQRVVLPLLVIQQFALIKIRDLKDKTPNKQEEISQFENMIIRSLIGNINASRNSA